MHVSYRIMYRIIHDGRARDGHLGDAASFHYGVVAIITSVSLRLNTRADAVGAGSPLEMYGSRAQCGQRHYMKAMHTCMPSGYASWHLQPHVIVFIPMLQVDPAAEP
jgi:hypothetical protein